MLSRCVKILLTRNCSNFSKLIRQCSKSTRGNPALAKVNTCKYKYIPWRYTSTINIPEEGNNFDDFKSKKYPKSDLSIKGAFKLMEEENYVGLKTFPSSLVELKEAVKNVHLSNQQAQIISSSEDFAKFFKALKDSIQEMPSENLVFTLAIWQKLHLPNDSEIYEQVLSRLAELIDSMQFNYAVQFYYIICETHKHSKRELMADLENYILENLSEKIYILSHSLAMSALLVSKEFFVPEEIKEDVLLYFIDLPFWNHITTYKYYLNVLIRFPLSNPSYGMIKNFYFQKLQNDGPRELDFVTSVLANYAMLLRDKRFHYNEKLFEDIISQLIDRKASLEQLRRVGIAQLAARHVSYNYLVYILKSIKNDNNLLIKDPDLFRTLLQLLGNSNHNYEMSNRWNGIEPLINDTDALVWALGTIEGNSYEMVCIPLYLISLGISNHEVFNVVMDRIKSSELEKNSTLNYFAGILNQSLCTLEPSFNGKILKLPVDEYGDIIPASRKDLLRDILLSLDWIRNVDDSILLFPYTKCGMLIDGLVAMNDEGDLYRFRNHKRRRGAVFIENISFPPTYKPIAFSVISEGSCSRNTKALRAIESVRLKTLEAMGYPSFYILEEEWNKLDKEKKGQFILKEIYKKSFEC